MVINLLFLLNSPEKNSDSQKDDFSLNKHSISPHQSIHFGDLPLPKNHNGELLIKKPLKESKKSLLFSVIPFK